MITQDGVEVRLTIVRPAGSKVVLPGFIFVHGGGWVLGDFPTHERFVRDLVADSGFTAIFANYTPSPEARYPTAIKQIHAAAKCRQRRRNQGRLGEPEDIVAVAVFLASDASAWITGETIRVGGGAR